MNAFKCGDFELIEFSDRKIRKTENSQNDVIWKFLRSDLKNQKIFLFFPDKSIKKLKNLRWENENFERTKNT